jgi:V/A-type H+/Na+-transporting ATPase subunit I
MIVPMKRVTLLVARDETDAALRRLRGLGIVHVTPVREPEAAETAGWAESRSRLEKALALIGPKSPGVPESSALAGAAAGEDGQALVNELLALEARREQARARLREAEERREWFRAWGDPSPSSLSVLAGAGLTIRIYQTDASILKRLPAGGTAVVAGRDKGLLRLAWLTDGPENGLDIKEEALPRVEVAEVEAEIARRRLDLTEIGREWETLAGRRDELRAYEHKLRRSAEFARVRAGLGREEAFSYLEGYCPTDAAGGLKKAAAEHGWGFLAADPDDPAEVPTLVRNPGWVRAIQPLFKFMGILPGYAEADVSLVFLASLCLFFALLIGDAGYGLLFLGAAIVARRKAKPGTPPDFFRLLILFSLSAVVWGALTGVYFGTPSIARLPVLRSLVIPRLDGFVEANGAFMMYLCFVIGLLHLTLAHLINIIRLWPSPRLLGQVGWIAMVWAVFFLVGNLVSERPLPSFFGPLFLTGILLALVFTNFQRRLLKGLAATLIDLPLSIIGTFSDMMSYLRLFAVGFASLTVAASFNAMAAGSGVHSPGQGLLAAVVLLFGHSLNIVLGGMSVLVHGVRLNMLEFSNHLGQQWTGLRYAPFRNGPDDARGRKSAGKEHP